MRKKIGYIQQRGPTTFRIAYTDLNHVRQFETIHGEREDAERELAIRLGELAKGIPVSSKPNTVLFEELCADVVNDYIVKANRSMDDIEARFRLHIIPALGRLKASQITTAHLKTYIVRRREEGAKTGTISRELEAIKRAFLLAVQERKFHYPPHIPKLDEDNVRAGFFTREEVDRLVSHLSPEVGAFVWFLFLTAWRYGECQRLEWRHVDFAAGEIRIDAGKSKSKNGEGRVFPMTAELRRLLETVRAAQDAKRSLKPVSVSAPTVATVTPFVFTIRGRPIGSFRKKWRSACHKAGLPCILNQDGKVLKAIRTPHDLRRSGVRHMLQQGLNQPTIKKLAGHKTDSMFERYLIISGEDLRAAAEVLDAGQKSREKSRSASGKS